MSCVRVVKLFCYLQNDTSVTYNNLIFSRALERNTEVLLIKREILKMNTREQNQMQETLAVLQTRGDNFTRQLLYENQRVTLLETQLKQSNEKITQIRDSNKRKAIELLNMHTTTTNGAYHRADGLDPTRLAEINQKKLVSNLEGRLNKALVRQNSVESENDAIKGKIDKLRRKVYNDSINRQNVEKELKQIQDDVDNVMKRAAAASEQRDKVVDQRNQLIRINSEERAKFDEEYIKLSFFIAEQNRVLENSISSVATGLISKLDPSVEVNKNIDLIDGINELNEKIAVLNKQYESSKEILNQTEEKNRLYEENFKELKRVSGLSSTDDIIKAFVRDEDESFSLFNYIQAVNQECDKTYEQQAQLEKDIEIYTDEQVLQENQRVSSVNEFKAQCQDALDEREKLENSTKVAKNTVLRIAKMVNALYIKLNCRNLEKTGQTKVRETKCATDRIQSDRKLTMFGGEEISERNILHRMELIERRSIEIIAEYAKKLASTRKGGRRPSMLLVRLNFYLTFLCFIIDVLSVKLNYFFH